MTSVMAQLQRQLIAAGIPAQRYSAHALDQAGVTDILRQPGAVLVDDVDREGHEAVAQALLEGEAGQEGWLIVEGVWNVTTHILPPLSEDSAAAVLVRLGLSTDRLSGEAAAQIVQMAGGLLGTILAIVRAALVAAITEQKTVIDVLAAEAGIAAVCQHRAQGLPPEHWNDLLELFDASAWVESEDLLQWVRRGWVIPTASEFVPHPMLGIVLRAP
jgi:NAD(P)-dependent dehydrogenase (short-subunit alcohol dehydrogenase family)